MKSVSGAAFAALMLTAAGCQSTGGASAEPLNLVAGAVSMARPTGLTTTFEPPTASTHTTIRFRGPARRRGDFNDCSARAMPVAPDDLNGGTIGELAATSARNLHAVHQTLAGLHDLSMSEPATGRANDPYVVRSSFTIDYTLRMSESYWGVSSGGWDYLIVRNCQTGGSAEELAEIENLTRPLFAAP